MNAARDRFVRRALIVLMGTLAAAAGIAVAAVFLLMRTPVTDTGFAPLIAVIAVVLLLLGLGGGSLLNGAALIRISRSRPDAVVFLARREPSLAPDLPMYLHRRDISADVSDRWLPGMVDERGIAVWSGGWRPRELLVMPWSELGTIEPLNFTSIDGRKRFGVAVDVMPFTGPLIVRVGYSMFGLQTSFDRAGTAAVIEATNARRPG